MFDTWTGEVTGLKTHTPVKKGRYSQETARLLARKRLKFDSASCGKERTLYLSSSDFATIVHHLPIRGHNDFLSREQLILKKFKKLEQETTSACCHGIYYEPEALRVYAQVTDNDIVSDIGWCRGPPADHDDERYLLPNFVGATPDGVCKHKPVLVEVKCPYYKREIKGGIPDKHWPQLQVQMAVTGIHTVHYVRYLPPTVSSFGHIDIQEAKFDPVWWKMAVIEAIDFFNHLMKIRIGEIQMPPVPQKKAKPEYNKKRRCRLITISNES